MADLDMDKKIFSRKEINTFIDGFKLLDRSPSDMPRDWQMHIGPGTIAKITFCGPVGADEWDALLAHIAFYKQWYKDRATTPLLNLSDAVEEICNRLTDANENNGT